MKRIDLLNKIAKGEIKDGFRIKGKNGDIYEYKEGKDCFYNVKDHMYVYSLGDFTKLNDEIEIIEEKPEKIEKLTYLDFADKVAVGNKINEIIDYLLEKESDK